jgi:hypothetical protein
MYWKCIGALTNPKAIRFQINNPSYVVKPRYRAESARTGIFKNPDFMSIAENTVLYEN